MKLIIQDNDGNQHIIISKVEHENDSKIIGDTVLDFVNFIEIER